jgi:hypothetical protein
MSCSICYDDFSIKSDIVIVKHQNDSTITISRKRGHYFHRSCIEQWKAHQTEYICPLDRDPIGKLHKAHFHQIVGLKLEYYDDFYELVKSIKISSKLLDQVLDIDKLDGRDRSLAYYACRYGDAALIKALFQKGANFNIGGKSEFTPLMVAVSYNHLNIVKYLLQKDSIRSGATVHDRTGNTAFCYACRNAHCAIIKEFLSLRIPSRETVLFNLANLRSKFKQDAIYGAEILHEMHSYMK